MWNHQRHWLPGRSLPGAQRRPAFVLNQNGCDGTYRATIEGRVPSRTDPSKNVCESSGNRWATRLLTAAKASGIASASTLRFWPRNSPRSTRCGDPPTGSMGEVRLSRDADGRTSPAQGSTGRPSPKGRVRFTMARGDGETANRQQPTSLPGSLAWFASAWLLADSFQARGWRGMGPSPRAVGRLLSS